MIQVTVAKRGLELKVVVDALPKIKTQMLEQLAEIAREAIASRLPRRTGRTASSVSVQIEEDEVSIRPPWKAIFIERGTRPHVIKPKRASVLAFQTLTGLTFARIVQHPGVTARPFRQQAEEEVKERISDVFASLWQETVRE